MPTPSAEEFASRLGTMLDGIDLFDAAVIAAGASVFAIARMPITDDARREVLDKVIHYMRTDGFESAIDFCKRFEIEEEDTAP